MVRYEATEVEEKKRHPKYWRSWLGGSEVVEGGLHVNPPVAGITFAVVVVIINDLVAAHHAYGRPPILIPYTTKTRHIARETNPMAPISHRILVAGGGPAGATAAFWLAKAGFEVIVAERSSEKFTYGQGIDITGPAIPIVQKMGLYGEIRSKTTGEGGFAICDDNSNIIAQVGTGGGVTLTQDIEIMRGDLTKILADAASASDRVTYRYGCNVSEIRQSEGHVSVVLSDRGDGRAEDFSAIVGADGLRSRVRQMILDRDTTKSCCKGVDQYCAYFSMKGEPEDVPNSRLQHAPGRRAILIRPVKVDTSGVDSSEMDSPKRSSCYMIYTVKSAKVVSALEQRAEKQKAVMAEVFTDFPGRIGERALQGMEEAKDFYYSETAQIKLPTWSNGRCVLVGDAGYAPSPASGQGTVLAILGAYLIAGELAASPEDPSAAFARYEKRLRKYVEKAQYIPLGGTLPRLANPETDTGIRILRFVFWLIAWSGVWKWFNIKGDTAFDLPEYIFDAAENKG